MISKVILQNLMNNKSFARQTLPHISEDYFEDIEQKTFYMMIKDYVVKYKTLPTNNTLKIEMQKNENISSSLFENLDKLIDEVWTETSEYDGEWLIENTEQWCKDRSLHNAIIESVEIIEEKKNTSQIPELIRGALQVEFNSSVGIEFFSDQGITDRWDAYNKVDTKYSTGIHALDNLFAGGIEHKALTVLMSGTSAGKTSSFCALTANFLKNGYDVLYITLEMAEEKIAQRIDANFLGVDINDVPMIKKSNYKKKLMDLKNKTKGRLVIKEYPPAAVSTSKIRYLIEELKIKREFKPQIIVIDYLNLMLSDRVKSDNMYSVVKSITEEVRGLCVEQKLAGLSGTQGNRATQDENATDMDMTNTSESIGLNNTVDALIGIIMPTDLREQNIQIWKSLKNRFGGVVNHKFPLKVNFARAGLYDMDEGEKFQIAGNDESNMIKLQTEEHRLRKRNAIVIEDDLEESFNVEQDLTDMISNLD